MTSSETRLGAHVQFGLVEIFQQHFQAAIAISGFAEIGLAVEVYVAENIFEFLFVLRFNRLQRDIDELANIGFRAPFIEVVKAAALWQDKTLVFQPAPDALIVAAVSFLIFLVVIFPDIGDVFEE